MSKNHQSSIINHQSQRGFSPLLLLLPVALLFVMAVFFIQQGRIGQFLNQPSPTPATFDQASTPELDDEGCNDPYNADCYIGDDEADNVRPEDLMGPD